MRRAWTSLGALLLVLIVTSGCRRPTDAEGAARGNGVELIGMRRLDTIAEIRRFELSNWRLWNLLDGWSERPEWNPDLNGGFVWAVARDASLWFYVLDVRDFQFLVKLAAAPQLQSQRITALVNGQPVSDFEAQPIFLEYRFVVPASLLRRGENTLTFRHSALTAPSPADDRTLAAAYASVLAGPNCLPLRPRGELGQTGVKTETRGDGAKEIRIIAPAELSYGLRIPPPGRLLLHASLPPEAEVPIVITATVDADGVATEIGRERIAPSLFGFPVSREMVMDAGAFRGREVVLRIGAYPETCKSAIGSVTIDRLALLTPPRSPSIDNAAGRSR